MTENPAPAELVPPVVPTKNVEGAERPPLADGFETVILAVPGVEISAAEIAAVNCVLETKLVARAFPLNWAVEAELKFVPAMFRVKAEPPATAELGTRETIEGAFGAGVGSVAGVGGGVRLNGGAGLIKFPPTRTTWPLLVLKAKPFCPHRINRMGLPVTFGTVIDLRGMKCV